MSASLVAVLVVGIAILGSVFARKRGYSNNQRIVLSGVAIGLLVLSLVRNTTPGNTVLLVVGILTLVASVLYLRREGR